MRSFLMAREHGKCQLCGKEFSKGNPSHIHHIIKDLKGGSDKESNLALLHEKCHTKLHKKKLFHLLNKSKSYKDATFMNIIRWRFKEIFSDCTLVYGNIISAKRISMGLEKTHYNDAFVIADGNAQIKIKPILLKQKHRNNRVLQLNRKGFKPAIRRQRHSIQPYDTITVENKKFMVKGTHKYGKAVVCTNNLKKFDFNIKKIKKVFHTSSIFKAYYEN
jgi:hypothetical protein